VRPASVGDAPPTGPVTAIIDTPQASLLAPPVSAAPPAAAPAAQQAIAATSTSSAPAYVQLSSQRSEAVAQQVAADLTARYGGLFNGANLEVNRVDLGAKGIYYRVRMPASSAQAASQLCTSIKTNGGDCFTM
jgi:hypothetical protein